MEIPHHFSFYGENSRFIDIYNEGSGYIDWSIASDSDFLAFSKEKGCVWQDERVTVSVIWEKVPNGIAEAKITVSGMESDKQIHSRTISVVVDNRRAGLLPDKTFIEADGYISMEAEHYSIRQSNGTSNWQSEQYLSRNGDSIKLYPNLLEPVEYPDQNHSAFVEYRIYVWSAGTFEMDLYRIPTLNEIGSMRVAASIDEEAPVIFTGTRAYVNDSDGTDSWGRGVYENAEILTGKIAVQEAGFHVLRVYQMDPGFVLDKIVIYTGERPYSYFGPPESRIV